MQNTLELARLADAIGFHRYWIAEHHAMDVLASSAPEILLARVGGETRRIRLGSGGIMLPHYSPFKVAETFRTLHALYPGRIDLGIGRAPGGSGLEAYALRRNRKEALDDFPEQLSELLAFLHKSFPENHRFNKIRLAPHAAGAPDVWLLGSSLWSAEAAAQFGLPYNFAHFIDPNQSREAISMYRQSFRPSDYGEFPHAMLALGVICAETEGEAQRLASSTRLLFRRIRQGITAPIAAPEEALSELAAIPEELFSQYFPDGAEWPRYIVGTPDSVRRKLNSVAEALQLDEIMVVTIVHDHAARLRSYALLAESFDLKMPSGGSASRHMSTVVSV